MSVITLNVNEANRTLSASDAAVFVVNDKNVDTVRFALLTGFTDIALDEHSALRVMYQRPRETQVRAKTLTFNNTDGLHDFYDWELLADDLAENGTITCALCILRTDSEVEEWHTTPYQIRVLGSIHTDDSDEADETITPTVAERVAILEAMTQRLYSMAGGAPEVVSSTSDMTDQDRVYVLTTDGYWYYYNGAEWTRGGEYGAISTDTTLSIPGTPADAEAAGTAIAALTAEVASNAFSREAKLALLELLKYVAWVDDDGAAHISDLERSFGFAAVEVEATYTQTHAVYVGMPLSHLKLDLVVTRIYNSGVTEVIDPADYTLSGSLILGTRTITVDVDGVTDTFTVDVSASPTKLYDWDLSSSLTDSVAGQTAVLTGAVMGDTGIVYAARGDSTTLGHVLGYDRTVEIDVLHFDFKGDPNENIRFAMWGGWGGEQGLIKRHNDSGGRNPGWSSYMERAWTSAPFIPGTSDEVINCINRKTVGIYIDASGYISMYLNGVLQGTSSNYAKEATLTGTDFQIGSTDQRVAYGGQMYDATISGVRIFSGNIYA